MLRIKLDKDWPTDQRYSSFKVWTTDDEPLLYYKLTLWAFGSSELKTKVSRMDTQMDGRMDNVKNSIPHHKQSLLGV